MNMHTIAYMLGAVRLSTPKSCTLPVHAMAVASRLQVLARCLCQHDAFGERQGDGDSERERGEW
jgi:hypothetical protein